MILHSNVIGNGQPFLILHGFLGMSDNWKTLGNRFAEDGYQVHLIDQRNHGRSFHHSDFSYEVLVEDVKQYCDAHKLNNIVLLGHSMGGKTAMFFAAMYPNYMSKLIIADIAPRFYPKHHDAILQGLSAMDFDEIKSRNEAENVLAQYVFDAPSRQFLMKNVYWQKPGILALRINLEVLRNEVDEVGEALPIHFSFDGETLFVKGALSEYITDQDEIQIKHQFPNSKIVTIPNAGHWVHAEDPNVFYAFVSGFLR